MICRHCNGPTEHADERWCCNCAYELGLIWGHRKPPFAAYHIVACPPVEGAMIVLGIDNELVARLGLDRVVNDPNPPRWASVWHTPSLYDKSTARRIERYQEGGTLVI